MRRGISPTTSAHNGRMIAPQRQAFQQTMLRFTDLDGKHHFVFLWALQRPMVVGIWPAKKAPLPIPVKDKAGKMGFRQRADRRPPNRFQWADALPTTSFNKPFPDASIAVLPGLRCDGQGFLSSRARFFTIGGILAG